MIPRHPIVEQDCAKALAQTPGLWEELRGQRVFLTGGTGFFGTWFLELFTTAVDSLGIDCEVHVLTRNPDAFAKGQAGHLASHRSIHLVKGDVMDFSFPEGEFGFVAHFGSTGPKAFHDTNPEGYFNLVIEGTRRVLAFAKQAKTRRFLLASTGAVYGNLASLAGAPVAESFIGAPNPLLLSSVNGESKRVAELLSVMASRESSLSVAIARGFSFIGPYLPTEAAFAAVDFMNDVVAGRPIVIQGDGSPIRSYLYASDLAVWLWVLLLRAPDNTAWNLGSEQAISIKGLAERIAACAPSEKSIPVKVLTERRSDAPPAPAYVPKTSKAQDALDLKETVALDEAIRRTLLWWAAYHS